MIYKAIRKVAAAIREAFHVSPLFKMELRFYMASGNVIRFFANSAKWEKAGEKLTELSWEGARGAPKSMKLEQVECFQPLHVPFWRGLSR